MDSGASDSFVSEELVSKMRLKTYPLRQVFSVKVANGQNMPVTMFTKLKVLIVNMPVRLFIRTFYQK